jgi:hypothetical protein
MAKQSGLGMNLYVAEYDLSGDTGSLTEVGGGPSPLDKTSINQSAFERIGGLRDGRFGWVSHLNTAAGQAHAALSPLPTTDVQVTGTLGTGLGDPAASLVAKQIGYDPTRGQDGDITFALAAQANAYGVEWGHLLTAGKRTDTGATNGTGVDLAASTSDGLQAYLHVFSFTGTDATVKIQESSDDGSGDAYADVTGGGFTTVTGAGTERIATAAGLTVERYLRVVTTTSGGFSNMVFAVVVVKNLTAVAF